MKLGKLIKRCVIYPTLFGAGCHTLVTGCPIPLWHLELLKDPLVVKTVGESELELADGRRFSLPFIKTLPPDQPLFQEAISRGVEIASDGEVFGLMWSDRGCGNDSCYWRRLRVNLSNLAAALYPEGIDDSLVHPDVIEFIQEHGRIATTPPSYSHRRLHLEVWDHVRMRSIRRDFENSAKNAGS